MLEGGEDKGTLGVGVVGDLRSEGEGAYAAASKLQMTAQRSASMRRTARIAGQEWCARLLLLEVRTALMVA